MSPGAPVLSSHRPSRFCCRTTPPEASMGSPKAELETVFTENLDFVEELYAKYLEDPASVDPAWREAFAATSGPRPRGSPFTPRSIFNPAAPASGATPSGASGATPLVVGTPPLRRATDFTVTGTPLKDALRQA